MTDPVHLHDVQDVPALMLALGHVVMSLRLPLSLRLLVPAVENSVAGNAYRPLDVLDTRAGITIEQVRGASPPTHAPGGGERLLLEEEVEREGEGE